MELTVIIHAIIFLLFWLTNLPFEGEVNNFLRNTIGLSANYLVIFYFFTLLVYFWSCIRLFLRWKKGSRVFMGTSILYLLFFYASYIVLFIKSPIQIARIEQGIVYFRVFFDVLIYLLVAWFMWRRFSQKGITSIAIQTTILATLFILPIIFPPGSVLKGTLPGKPKIIAHRGASILAPENTFSAMQLASDLGVYGVETDITISSDGIFFLMHDSTLERTTNIREIFPTRIKDAASSFAWSELAQLDAGSWFSSSLSGESIPSLTSIIQLIREKDLFFIYDLRVPPDNGPISNETLMLFLKEVKEGGIASKTWFLTNPDEINIVRTEIPNAVLAIGLDYEKPEEPSRLIEMGYQVVNSEYGLSNRWITNYKAAGFWVNLWTVDEPWQYSRLWLEGVNSVTSNNIQGLLKMERPIFAITSTIYITGWSLYCVTTGVFFLIRKRSDL